MDKYSKEQMKIINSKGKFAIREKSTRLIENVMLVRGSLIK